MKVGRFILKSTYKKPMMAVEYFTMTQSVASCDIKIGFSNADCIMDDPDAPDEMKDFAASGYFIGGICDNAGVNMDSDDNICTHTQTANTFNS